MSAKESTRVEYGKTLAQLGAENPQIVVLDADLSGSTQTQHFAKVFKDRFFNMGIAEQDLMGTAAGLALGGKIPFASTFAMFATGRAWEQIRQTIAYGNLNVKIVASHGGVTRRRGRRLPPGGGGPGPDAHPPQHGGAGARGRSGNPGHGPLGRGISRAGVYPHRAHAFAVIYEDSYGFELGRGQILREGGDVTLMGVGHDGPGLVWRPRPCWPRKVLRPGSSISAA